MRGASGWRNPHIARALAFAAASAGDARGLPRESRALLLRLGFLETYRHRSSAGKSRNLVDVHEATRLTESGFKAAGAPWRVGSIRFAFGRLKIHPDHPWGRILTLSVIPDGLRIALAPVPGIQPPLVRGERPPPPPDYEVETYADPVEAAAAMRDFVARARSLTGMRGRIVDPGFLAWDGGTVGVEDIAAIEAGDVPSVDEALERIDAILAGTPAPRP
jgi:hypothetical protein